MRKYSVSYCRTVITILMNVKHIKSGSVNYVRNFFGAIEWTLRDRKEKVSITHSRAVSENLLGLWSVANNITNNNF